MPTETPDSDWGKYASLGLEMFVGVGLGVLGGYWVDKKFGWSPWGVLCGALLGFAAGLYLLLKEALKSNRD
jgi:ATP synthase protein I